MTGTAAVVKCATCKREDPGFSDEHGIIWIVCERCKRAERVRTLNMRDETRRLFRKERRSGGA